MGEQMYRPDPRHTHHPVTVIFPRQCFPCEECDHLIHAGTPALVSTRLTHETCPRPWMPVVIEGKKRRRSGAQQLRLPLLSVVTEEEGT